MILNCLLTSCASIRDLTVIIELQTATSSTGGHAPARGRMTSRAWTKLDLFDLHGQLISGRWRTSLRMTPVKPNLSTSDLKSVTQVGEDLPCSLTGAYEINHKSLLSSFTLNCQFLYIWYSDGGYTVRILVSVVHIVHISSVFLLLLPIL